MITRGVPNLDVLIQSIQNTSVQMLRINIIFSLLVVPDEIYYESLLFVLLFFHLQFFQILSKIFYIIIDTYIKYYTNAELYNSFGERSKMILFRVCFQSRLPDLRPRRRRLTSRFEGIENVKNSDVEKWYNFNFLFCRKL